MAETQDHGRTYSSYKEQEGIIQYKLKNIQNFLKEDIMLFLPDHSLAKCNT